MSLLVPSSVGTQPGGSARSEISLSFAERPLPSVPYSELRFEVRNRGKTTLAVGISELYLRVGNHWVPTSWKKVTRHVILPPGESGTLVWEFWPRLGSVVLERNGKGMIRLRLSIIGMDSDFDSTEGMGEQVFEELCFSAPLWNPEDCSAQEKERRGSEDCGPKNIHAPASAEAVVRKK
jgi:hypothetical protein